MHSMVGGTCDHPDVLHCVANVYRAEARQTKYMSWYWKPYSSRRILTRSVEWIAITMVTFREIKHDVGMSCLDLVERESTDVTPDPESTNDGAPGLRNRHVAGEFDDSVDKNALTHERPRKKFVELVKSYRYRIEKWKWVENSSHTTLNFHLCLIELFYWVSDFNDFTGGLLKLFRNSVNPSSIHVYIYIYIYIQIGEDSTNKEERYAVDLKRALETNG